MSAVGSVNFDETSLNHKQAYDTRNRNTYLEEKLDEAKNKQGMFGNTWNGFKEFTHFGQSASDCDKMLDKYNSGEISFEEAVEYIDSFENKQENMKGLMSNILTGIGAIALTTLTGGSWLIVGSLMGAATKTVVNLLDRATNKIEGDEYELKTIAKDAISGGVTGATSAVSSGVAKGIRSAKFGLSVGNGTGCGLMCGSASGSTGYLIDVIFGDKEFDLGDFAKSTATSAFVSGTVGGFVGAVMYGAASLANTVGKSVSKTTAEIVAQDAATSSARKILGQIERNIIAT